MKEDLAKNLTNEQIMYLVENYSKKTLKELCEFTGIESEEELTKIAAWLGV